MASNLRREGESTNAHGCRGTLEIAYERESSRQRLVVLGDSFTYGLGVRDEEVFCARLQEALSGWEVINLGTNGYGLDQELLLWSEEGVRYAPDRVILVYYVPDFHRHGLSVREFPKPWFELEDGELALRGVPVTDPWSYLEECSSSGPRLHVLDLASAVERRFLRFRGDDRFDFKAELMVMLLDALKSSVDQVGSHLDLIIVPDRKLRKYPDHDEIVKEIERAAHRLDVPCRDLTGVLEEQRALDDEPFNSNGHWSVEGHRKVALELAGLFSD